MGNGVAVSIAQLGIGNYYGEIEIKKFGSEFYLVLENHSSYEMKKISFELAQMLIEELSKQESIVIRDEE